MISGRPDIEATLVNKYGMMKIFHFQEPLSVLVTAVSDAQLANIRLLCAIQDTAAQRQLFQLFGKSL